MQEKNQPGKTHHTSHHSYLHNSTHLDCTAGSMDLFIKTLSVLEFNCVPCLIFKYKCPLSHVIKYVTVHCAFLGIRVFIFFVNNRNVVFYLFLKLNCMSFMFLYKYFLCGYIGLRNISVATHSTITLVCWLWMFVFLARGWNWFCNLC